MAEFSVFEYLYRDASNYKSWGTIILHGTATEADIQILKEKFESGTFFIAEQLGIPPLYAELWHFSNGPSIDDHVWHSFHTLRPATDEDVKEPVFATVKSFMAKISAVQQWNPELSAHWDI